uniref:Uncharacterized protein n=1 Tax=Anguilla anguilla TaxID=7936 RepID=A0A0E9QRU6_ANGAN
MSFMTSYFHLQMNCQAQLSYLYIYCVYAAHILTYSIIMYENRVVYLHCISMITS